MIYSIIYQKKNNYPKKYPTILFLSKDSYAILRQLLCVPFQSLQIYLPFQFIQCVCSEKFDFLLLCLQNSIFHVRFRLLCSNSCHTVITRNDTTVSNYELKNSTFEVAIEYVKIGKDENMIFMILNVNLFLDILRLIEKVLSI